MLLMICQAIIRQNCFSQYARAAGSGTPINIFSTYPVRTKAVNGFELYMIHNGSFYRDDIALALMLIIPLGLMILT